MKRTQTTDFDVISGPSMASACPVVETAPTPPPSNTRPAESTTADTAPAAAADAA